MASRRDELNAYSFARKRTNAAFLKPLPNGSIESAPRPLKAVVPSIMMGVVMLVGFGACGILKPVAPQGWDEVGKNVIVGDKSTTRYIVLKQGKQKLLHPILNLASARLLIDPNFKVVKVKEEELDGKIPHGPAIGIPYAPDRLPTTEDADAPKTWAVCNRPGSGLNSKPQQSVFILGGKDKQAVEGKGKLGPSQALFVEDPQHKKWLVDSEGKAFEFNGGAKRSTTPCAASSSAPPSPSRCHRTSWTPSSCSRASSASACPWSPERGPDQRPEGPGPGQDRRFDPPGQQRPEVRRGAGRRRAGDGLRGEPPGGGRERGEAAQ